VNKNNKNVDLSLGKTTFISAGTHITGDLNFSGNLEIEGKVTGNIISSSEGDQIRVASAGYVVGDIHAPIAIVNGRVEGSIYSCEEVHLAANCHVEGNLYYMMVEIEKGAQMNGTFVYQPNQDDIKVLESMEQPGD